MRGLASAAAAGIILFGATASACGEGASGAAPGTPLHRPVTVDYRGLPVADALKDLAAKAGVKFEFTAELLEGLAPVNFEARDREAGRVAVRILKPRGLGIRAAGEGRYEVYRLDPYDEFKPKREEVFGFARRPEAVREGDRVTISFETKGFCDATVAVEDADGRIIRHLASGVLGEDAPEPFQWNSKRQTIVWDGKDDQGRYVDDKDSVTVRVSLGLKPRFERTLFWSPHKRISNIAPLLAPAPEGVYVFEGLGVDHLKLFDHDGNYVRTIYPFPAGRIPDVVGLQKRRFVPGEPEMPLKMGYELASLLTSGSSAWGGEGGHEGGYAATAMAIHPPLGTPAGGGKRRIALAYHRLNRLTSDGDSGGLPILGPSVSFTVRVGQLPRVVGPTSIAFSPDGKYLYLTGYVWKTGNYVGEAQCYHMVMRMEYEKQDEPHVFLGAQKTDDGFGSGSDQFCVPVSVACDPQGRVYVADHCNQRIQVFSPEGRYLKTIPAPYPSAIRIDPVTGEIWSFSFETIGPSQHVSRVMNYPGRISPTVCRLGTFDKPAKADPQPIPVGSLTGKGGWIATGGQTCQVAVDTYGKEPALWLAGRKPTVSVEEANWESGGGIWVHLGGWENRGIRIAKMDGGEWKVAVDFAKIAEKKVHRLTPPQFSRQRLYVNPADRKLYVCEEQTGAGKSFYTVIRIDPDTGNMKEVKLPGDTEDIIFDIEGLAYLTTDHEIVRFDTVSWREVPWDYGELRPSVRFASSGALPKHDAVSALPIPGERPVWWHSSGMWISPRRRLAVICNIPEQRRRVSEAKRQYMQEGMVRSYAPFIYPGRSGNRVVLVFDQHGKIVYDDAVPGLTNADGIGIDNADNLYIMVAAPRVIEGQPYQNDKAETLMKFRPGKGRFVSAGESPVPLPPDMKPKRPPDVTKYGLGDTWVEGAEWMYGGVGYGGQGGSCTCWHSRFQLDYFGRSFAPETIRFSIAVLDSNGNLILRVGRYGNVDDGLPLVVEGGPQNPRPIGGDEVALAHAAYVGVHTDRRLFIHDGGNARILLSLIHI
ncbi:MAG: hypothetical protein N3A38_12655 [Planctomycetota bacterium]|nr:hypothetical protein [Planctomycetota bacterium]